MVCPKLYRFEPIHHTTNIPAPSQQNQQLAYRQPPLPESEAWLDSLNETLPYIRIEKDNHQITKICSRARSLLKSIDNDTHSAAQTLAMVQEMHDLDRTASTWRQGPGWAYKTIHRSEITTRGAPSAASKQLPEFVQLHHDVWIAYEWNYHRTGRIILHEHLLECLDRLDSLYSSTQEEGPFPTDLSSIRQASLTTIRALVDEVLSTVPQSLGDIDHEGCLTEDKDPGTPEWKGVGGYFLLWPIKVIEAMRSPTAEQKNVAQGVFERIKECTGMKSALGEKSSMPTLHT